MAGAAPRTHRRHTYEEYLAYERDSVLSVSTEEDDRGDKWHSYQRIPSLREYVLVSQTHPRIESFLRMPDGTWSYRVATEGNFDLESGATIDLAKLYADLPP